jgi:hypothetical protein
MEKSGTTAELRDEETLHATEADTLDHQAAGNEGEV